MHGLLLHTSSSVLTPSPLQGQQPEQYVLRILVGAPTHLNGNEDDVIEAHQRQRILTEPSHHLCENVGEHDQSHVVMPGAPHMVI